MGGAWVCGLGDLPEAPSLHSWGCAEGKMSTAMLQREDEKGKAETKGERAE